MNHFPRPAADAPPGRPRALCREPCAAARREPVPRGFFDLGKMHEPVAARSAPRCRAAASPVLALPVRPAAARAACAPAAAVGQLSRPGRRHIRSCPAGRVPPRLTAVPHSRHDGHTAARRPGPARPGPRPGIRIVSCPAAPPSAACTASQMADWPTPRPQPAPVRLPGPGRLAGDGGPEHSDRAEPDDSEEKAGAADGRRHRCVRLVAPRLPRSRRGCLPETNRLAESLSRTPRYLGRRIHPILFVLPL